MDHATNTLDESRLTRFIDFRYFSSLISLIFLIENGSVRKRVTYPSSLSEAIYNGCYNGCLHKNATLRYALIACETICYTLFII